MTPFFLAAVLLSGSPFPSKPVSVTTAGPTIAFYKDVTDKLTEESLLTLLKNLGYEPEKVGVTYRIKIEKPKWNFVISISISSNTRKLWMSSFLAQVPDIEKIPQSAMMKLLETNSDIGPAAFVLVEDSKNKPNGRWLKMQYGQDNRGITPAIFRTELDWFLERLQETGTTWSALPWKTGN